MEGRTYRNERHDLDFVPSRLAVLQSHLLQSLLNQHANVIAEDNDGQSTLVGEGLVARGVVLEVVTPMREAGNVDV